MEVSALGVVPQSPAQFPPKRGCGQGPLGQPRGDGQLHLHMESPPASSPVLGFWDIQQQGVLWQPGVQERGRQEQGPARGGASPSPLISILLNTMSVNSSAVIFSWQRLMDRMAWRERGAQALTGCSAGLCVHQNKRPNDQT